MKKPSIKSLQLRKEKLDAKLRKFGLDNTITDITLFDETQYNYVHPREAAERLLILLAVAFTAYNFDESEKVMDWLKKEQHWKSVSPKEKEFFRNPDPGEEEKQTLSWRFEGAHILAWALGKVPSSAEPGSECNKEQINEFLKNVPIVGNSTEKFFNGLQFRPLPDILCEMLFYEIANAYFRSLAVQDKENTSQVHPKASSERHLTLSWLRSSDESDWDILTA